MKWRIDEEEPVSMYKELIECLSCSNSRSFLHHADRVSRPLSQQEAFDLPRRAVLTCGRCGSRSLLRLWGDAVPYATTGYVGRRRRRSTSVGQTDTTTPVEL